MAGEVDEHGSGARRSTTEPKRAKSSKRASKASETLPLEPDSERVRARRTRYYETGRTDRSSPRKSEDVQHQDNSGAGGQKEGNSERHLARDPKIQRSSTRRRHDSDQGHVYTSRHIPDESGGKDSPPTEAHGRNRHKRSEHLAPKRLHTVAISMPSLPWSGSKRSNTRSSRAPTMDKAKQQQRGSERESGVAKSASVKKSRGKASRSRKETNRLKPSSATPVPATPIELTDCLTCGSDDIPVNESALLACGHRMCHSCLKRIFVLSTTDPAHMPPRCCTSNHIPLKHVEHLVSTRFKILWNTKYQEYRTANRLYCSRKGCGVWIPPAAIKPDTRHPDRSVGVCKRCKTRVCASCANPYHKPKTCPNDPATAALIDSAKEKGWQRCYSCKAMVELKEGCNHMTCRCTAEFCMLCGEKWKTCNCPWFNQHFVQPGDRLQDMRVPEVLGLHGGVGYADEMEGRRRQEREDEFLARRLQLADDFGGILYRHVPAPPFAAAAAHAARPAPPQRRRNVVEDMFGVGNGAGHLLNDDFVRTATNVVFRAFDDVHNGADVAAAAAAFGRRGERESGRVVSPPPPIPPPPPPTAGEQAGHGRAEDPGLARNAFGTPSVLNAAGLPGRSSSSRSGGNKVKANFGRIARNGGAAQGGRSARIRGWLENVEEEPA